MLVSHVCSGDAVVGGLVVAVVEGSLVVVMEDRPPVVVGPVGLTVGFDKTEGALLGSWVHALHDAGQAARWSLSLQRYCLLTP